MFGALCHRLLKPLIKNFWLITITAIVRRSCKSPIATWFAARKAGTGHPHIICPMEKYMRTRRKPRDQRSRLFSTGVSLSFSISSPVLEPALLDDSFALPVPPFKEAP